MNKIKFVAVLLILFVTLPLFARIRIATSYPYIADLTKRIGKDKVRVRALAPGNWDPHFVVPRPSLIAKVRNADLLIMNGAEVEIGWLPPVIRNSKNRRVQPGSSGLLDLSRSMRLIDVPKNVSRAHGDVHPSGNPHYYLDPYNIPKAAAAIYRRLCKIDGSNCNFYKKNYEAFRQQWMRKVAVWNSRMKSLRGKKVIQYHKNYNYFFKRYGIRSIAEIEPLPGIPPTASHIDKIIRLIKMRKVSLIISDVYHSKRPARFIAEKSGAKVVILPHDVNSVNNSGNLVKLFDEIVRRLTHD